MAPRIDFKPGSTGATKKMALRGLFLAWTSLPKPDSGVFGTQPGHFILITAIFVHGNIKNSFKLRFAEADFLMNAPYLYVFFPQLPVQ